MCSSDLTRQFYIMNAKSGEQTYVEASKELQKRFPPGTLVVTMTFSGALYFYTDFPVLRWDQVKPERFQEFVTAAHKAGRQICAVDFKWEEEKVLRDHCPGNWEPVTKLYNAAIWRLVPPPATK